VWNGYKAQTTDTGGPWLIGSLKTTYKYYGVLLRWYEKRSYLPFTYALNDAIVGRDRNVHMHINNY